MEKKNVKICTKCCSIAENCDCLGGHVKEYNRIDWIRNVLGWLEGRPDGYWPEKDGSLDIEKFKQMPEVKNVENKLIEVGITSKEDLEKIGAIPASMILF
jgi:hypothetical protein